MYGGGGWYASIKPFSGTREMKNEEKGAAKSLSTRLFAFEIEFD